MFPIDGENWTPFLLDFEEGILNWIIITLNIRVIDLINIVIIPTFRPICPLAFFRCFLSKSGVHTESQNESFIWATGVDSFNSINNDRVQVLIYRTYFLLFLLVLGIEPATSLWFH